MRPFLVLIWLSVILLAACSGPSPATPSAAPAPATAVAPTLTLAPTAAPPPTQTVPAASPTPTGGSFDLPAGDALPWWNDTVFYEIFVRSFADSDGNGMGDLNGLIQKLDYLNDGDPATSTDLGVTGIWLMPIHPSPSYHGYDVTDYRSVNPQYGSMEDFRRLLEEAHRRGIRVIIDMVMNHTASSHPWFTSALDPASPYHEYYVWSNSDPNYKGPDGQTVWHRAANGRYYYGFFWNGMPDLNYRSPAVVAEMEEIARFWLEDVGVDGFRLDAARHMVEVGKLQTDTDETHSFWKDFRVFSKQVGPESLLVGEIWVKTNSVARYTQGDELDLAFDFDLASAWVIAASSKDARPARTVLRRDQALFRPGQFAVFLTNHDQNRLMTQVGGDEQKARAAAALLLTSPGVPFLYYGEEIGMSGQKPDEDIRTPMQWSGSAGAGFSSGAPWRQPQPDYASVNVEEQDARPESLLNLYRSLIQLRNRNEALRKGQAYPILASQKQVYALLRVTPQQAVLVLVNMGPEEMRDIELELDESPLRGAFTVTPLLGEGQYAPLQAGEKGDFEGYLPIDTLPGGAVVVLELKP